MKIIWVEHSSMFNAFGIRGLNFPTYDSTPSLHGEVKRSHSYVVNKRSWSSSGKSTAIFLHGMAFETTFLCREVTAN